MVDTLSQSSVVLPTEGNILHAFGDEYTFLLGPSQTGGKLTMFIGVTPPAGGPPPHSHENEDEWFHVLEGRVEFFRDGDWTEVPAGSSVYIPRGVLHTFRNVGDTPLRMLVNTSPCGFESFIAQSAEEFAKQGAPDMGRIMEIAERHGIRFQ